MKSVRTALTIAGSDPSGGAGIQSDLKTFSRLRVYGMAVIAALTAQNTREVTAVAAVPADFLARQLDAVLSDITPDAVKTGMLLRADAVEVVAQKMHEYRVRHLVVDPVMISTSGTTLLDNDALGVFCRALVPQAFLITPNLDEARALTASPIENLEDMEEAALRIHGMGAAHVLIKGGHAGGDASMDVFFDGTGFSHLQSPRISGSDTHGTGCVLSAAIAGYLALGRPIGEAVRAGKEFVTEAIRNGLRIGGGNGPCDPLSLSRDP